MNTESFIKFLQENHEQIEKLFARKNKEYSSKEQDIFDAFRQAFSLHEQPSARAWELLSKHLISIRKIIRDREEGVIPKQDLIQEKFLDAHVYLYLIQAMLQEDRDRILMKPQP